MAGQTFPGSAGGARARAAGEAQAGGWQDRSDPHRVSSAVDGEREASDSLKAQMPGGMVKSQAGRTVANAHATRQARALCLKAKCLVLPLCLLACRQASREEATAWTTAGTTTGTEGEGEDRGPAVVEAATWAAVAGAMELKTAAGIVPGAWRSTLGAVDMAAIPEGGAIGDEASVRPEGARE